MHYCTILWDWNSLESIRSAHGFFERGALLFFALLVVFDVLAHLDHARPDRAKTLGSIGLVCFALAVAGEIFAFQYGERSDELAEAQAGAQRLQIAALEQESAAFQAQIADANARVKQAEAQIAGAMAASATADAKAEGFRADIATANKAAAEAGRAAEQERLERVKLQKEISWRTLDKAQRERLEAEARDDKGSLAFPILIDSLAGNLEALIYASQLRQVLSAAGLKVTQGGWAHDLYLFWSFPKHPV